MKKTELRMIEIDKIVTLKRNPQYLTPKQMESLKKSIARDGFCVPILVRKIEKEKYEIISGNHRFMAAIENDLSTVPCAIMEISDRDAKRLAVNLNTIHGEPSAELLAPFLADLDIETLREIHFEDKFKKELLEFDETLKTALEKMNPPDAFNRNSSTYKTKICICPICGRKHFEQ